MTDFWKWHDEHLELCELCNERLPIDSVYSLHDECADALRASMDEPTTRTLEDADNLEP